MRCFVADQDIACAAEVRGRCLWEGDTSNKSFDWKGHHRHPWRALLFLHRWPDHRRAAQLILRKPQALQGSDEQALKAMAQTLEPHDPLAASLCLRAMLEAILHRGRSSDYNCGVRYLEQCLRLAPLVNHWGRMEDHNTWVVNLLWFFSHRQAFFNKLDFDPQVPEPALPDSGMW